MVWFQCEDCGDTLKKPKVFDKWSVQGHTSCVTEHEKYALSITKAGNEGLMSGAVARDAGGGGGGGPSGGGGGVLGEEFLAKSPPWDCSCCKVKCTSVETLMGHASGKKHKSKSRSALAAMGRGPDGAPLPPPKEEPKESKESKGEAGEAKGDKKEKKKKRDKEDESKEAKPTSEEEKPAKKAKRDKDGAEKKEKKAKKEKK